MMASPSLSMASPAAQPARFTIPYAWLILFGLFVGRAFHPAASGSIDPDVYWHLLYGHWILEHGALPTVDFWSWTMAGEPYRLTQWLGEVVMAMGDQAGGEAGRQLLAAAGMSAALILSYATARRSLESSMMAIALTMVCATVIYSIPCRPHLFTFVGLASIAFLLDRYYATPRILWLAPLPLIFALWVNLHGGYATGLAYVFGVAFASLIAAYAQRRLPDELGRSLPVVIAAAFSLLATIANPYGIDVWEATLAVGRLKSVSLGITGEWTPTQIRSEIGFAYLLVNLATVAILATSRRRASLRDLLICLPMLFVGWWANRMTVMVGLLMVPVLAPYLRECALYELLAKPETRHQIDGRLRWPGAVILAALIVAGAYAAGRADTHIEQRIREDYPVAELAFMNDNGLHGRLLNTMEAGGYLIAKGQRRVFLDTRLDFYGDDYYFAFAQANAGLPGWREFVARWDPEIALLENSAPLTRLLTTSGLFKAVMTGHRYTVLVRVPTTPYDPNAN